MATLFLYTDFGLEGPYVGQMRAAVARQAADLQVVDLCHDLAPFEPRAAAYLLAALADELPADCAVVGVVDPGVGTERAALVLRADGRWFVGPDNGLLAVVARRARRVCWQRLDWRPARLSSSFHGRDLFAPAAALLLTGQAPETVPLAGDPVGADWPDVHPAVIYIDRYGNAMTGIRAAGVPAASVVRAAGYELHSATTFGAVAAGAAFWYGNSVGLLEIAVNQGRADQRLGLRVGTPVSVADP